ncbi:MAG: nitroreductase family deazaflavin-dependent oxidoreductase [Actinobacteria bacterium]|nr:nitroreductase family deazaflavin-dependent oxidoreductase [Actinomycetota bacterium]
MPVTGEYEPSTSQWVADQVADYEASNGTRSNTMGPDNTPVVIVTMRGAKTGKVRKIGLIRVEHDGEYALVASKGGAPEHPGWYYNLLADPQVMVQDGSTPHDFIVREVSGDERATWWDRSATVFPQYLDYAKQTDREIPVLVARRVS